MTVAPGLPPRVALCHEWFTTLGGSDVCAARIAELLDVDAVFTFTYREELVRHLLGDRGVRLAHRMGATDLAKDHWQRFLPLMPHAWRSLDLSEFDVVITSSHSCTNAVAVAPGSVHISYCYTPMRYAWEPHLEKSRLPAVVRPLWPVAASWLKRADRRWSRNVDAFIAISNTVAARIERFYDREAEVVYPPVDTGFFVPDGNAGDYFLAAGRFVGYKRFDLAVNAFSRLGQPLVIAGSGPELSRLRASSAPNIRFEVDPSRERLRELYRGARALVFPGIEDFGIVPVEAQSCGTPVIARGVGGSTETVVDGVTGLLYGDGSVDALVDAVKRFEEMSFDRGATRANAERFDERVFDERFSATVRSIIEGGPQ